MDSQSPQNRLTVPPFTVPWLLGLALLAMAGQAQAVVCRVNDDSSATSPNGNSWTNAYQHLQDALANTNCTEIWVADGVYYPDDGAGQTNSDDAARFTLNRPNLAVYGGFAGTEGALGDRNLGLGNLSILSADIDQNDPAGQSPIVTDPDSNPSATTPNFGNAITVVIATDNADETTILDGFTITGAYGQGGGFDNSGGGMIIDGTDPTLRNLSFVGNSSFFGGSGVYSAPNASNTPSNPSLTNVEFLNNVTTDGKGAGMLIEGGTPTLTQITFRNNEARGTLFSRQGGGGLFSQESFVTLTDVIFDSNTTARQGGGMAIDRGEPVLDNVQFSLNTAADGGGLANNTSAATLTNVSFRGNLSDGFSLGGGGMINSSGNPNLRNVLFSGNVAEFQDGGGLLVVGGTPTLVNTTFSANETGDRGGAIALLSSLDLDNSIVWNNAASNAGDQIFIDTGDTLTISSNVILQGGSAALGGTGNVDNSQGTILSGTANNPAFVSGENPSLTPSTGGDYRLASTSPAIDIGNSGLIAGVGNDLDGGDRFLGCVDLGPYESGGTGDCLTISPVPTNGTVNGPDGLSCGSQGSVCQVSVISGTSVSLDAVGDTGTPDYGLKDWSGDAVCNGQTDNPLVFTISGPTTCEANFQEVYTLSIDPVPDGGSVVVTQNSGDGPVLMTCNDTTDPSGGCDLTVPNPTLLYLDALPDPNHEFEAWSGTECEGFSGALDNPKVMPPQDFSCSVTFFSIAPAEYTLTITPSLDGTVTGPNGLNCGSQGDGTCEIIVNENENEVDLTANADNGFDFNGWTGTTGSDCEGGVGSPLTITVNADITCEADFGVIQYTLTVTEPTEGGTIKGTIAGSPTALNCGTDGDVCQLTVDTGTVVALEATPDTGYTFGGWSGDCTATAVPTVAEVTVDAAGLGCAGAFEVIQYTLTIEQPTNGDVLGGTSAFEIECGITAGDCSLTAPANSAITLQTDSNLEFLGWTGDCTTLGSGTPLSFNLTGDLTCGVNFGTNDPLIFSDGFE